MKQYLFPRKIKYWGLILIILAFPLLQLINNQVIDSPFNSEISRNVLKAILLAGFLLLILSKEEIEDEFINSCRLLAFKGAFLFSLVAFIVNAITGDEPKSSFSIIFIQALVYLSLFYTFKRGVIKW